MTIREFWINWKKVIISLILGATITLSLTGLDKTLKAISLPFKTQKDLIRVEKKVDEINNTKLDTKVFEEHTRQDDEYNNIIIYEIESIRKLTERERGGPLTSQEKKEVIERIQDKGFYINDSVIMAIK